MPLDLQKGFLHPFFLKKHLLFGVNNTPCKIIFGIKMPLTWGICTPGFSYAQQLNGESSIIRWYGYTLYSVNLSGIWH